MRPRFTSRLLAVLALTGLIAGPLAPQSMLAAPDRTVTATAHDHATDMPDGMPCCPETQKKPDCGDCPFTATCAGTIFPPPNSVALTAPIALVAVVSPMNDPELTGLAQGPPAKPPKA